jgi:hypothetical protein
LTYFLALLVAIAATGAATGVVAAAAAATATTNETDQRATAQHSGDNHRVRVVSLLSYSSYEV